MVRHVLGLMPSYGCHDAHTYVPTYPLDQSNTRSRQLLFYAKYFLVLYLPLYLPPFTQRIDQRNFKNAIISEFVCD